jgi:hypothetical protein
VSTPKLPDALDRHPAGASTGRLLAGDEILRLLLTYEDRHGSGALSNEQIAGELSWKPPAQACESCSTNCAAPTG